MKRLFSIVLFIFCFLGASSSLYAKNKIKLVHKAKLISLYINQTRYTFTKQSDHWSFSCAYVNGKKIVFLCKKLQSAYNPRIEQLG